MFVIIDAGRIVRKFTSPTSASEYAERMMKKQHDVWLVSGRTARITDFS